MSRKFTPLLYTYCLSSSYFTWVQFTILVKYAFNVEFKMLDFKIVFLRHLI